jgi:hypothetical protein
MQDQPMLKRRKYAWKEVGLRVRNRGVTSDAFLHLNAWVRKHSNVST